MSLEHTKKQLKKIRTDALYGKKRHFNAGNRIERYNSKISCFIIFLNILTGSGFFYLLLESDNDWIKYVGSFLAFFGYISCT